MAEGRLQIKIFVFFLDLKISKPFLMYMSNLTLNFLRQAIFAKLISNTEAKCLTKLYDLGGSLRTMCRCKEGGDKC